MADFYEFDKDLNGENIEPNSEPNDKTDNFEDIKSSSADTQEQSSEQENASGENSYEWNSDSTQQQTSSNEYHYSYVNGNNENASHNPNNYDNAYSSTSYNPYSSSDTSSTSNQSSSYGDPYNYNSQQSTYNGYSSNPNYGGTTYSQYNAQSAPAAKGKPKKNKVKKPKKPVSRGFIAAMLAVTVVASGAVGFGGGYLANSLGNGNSNGLTVNQVSASNTSSNASNSTSTTSDVVKKVADSVVEIATEAVVTGNFAQQYVQQGAGSGVIISDDGYIITNYHVIEGANNITVTLRDGTTNYTATLGGGDKDNDIALLKIDATGLSPATFGDSSNLAVGDYVVAIGNPLGELGGTVTDGIISALAREVKIDDNNMTLLQTNAQISPGNSGGGLFNSNGELIGITNAKDSATEVEGISFAIPINNVLDIINDLKSYGYVTGKIDLGMQLTDINSNTAFYYGMSQTGCYVSSVTKGSNAEQAGFKAADLITKVNDTEVSSTSDVDKALKDCKVGDKVKFTVSRSGQTTELTLTLAEYVPTSSNTKNSSKTTQNSSADSDDSDSNNDFWSQMFGWQ